MQPRRDRLCNPHSSRLRPDFGMMPKPYRPFRAGESSLEHRRDGRCRWSLPFSSRSRSNSLRLHSAHPGPLPPPGSGHRGQRHTKNPTKMGCGSGPIAFHQAARKRVRLSWNCPRTTSARAGEHEQPDNKETRWCSRVCVGADSERPTYPRTVRLSAASDHDRLGSYGKLRAAELRPETLEAK
jgi:hypothetical protein